MTRRRVLTAALASWLAVAGVVSAGPASAADVNTAPLRSITVPGTDVFGVVRGPDGLLYVTTGDNSVLVFPSDADGGALPLRVIQGDNTGLSTPRQPALDLSGRLVVPNAGTNSIAVYAAGAGGNVSMVRALTAGLSFPIAVAVDSAGNIYAANYSSDSITVYEPLAGAGTAPIRTIQGPSTGLDKPTGVMVAPNGDVYVANYGGNSVQIFAANANGDVSPKRTISGASTLPGPESVALDSSGNLYVTNFDGGVVVFAPGASGEATPVTRLVGSETGLGGSFGCALAPDRSFTVANLSKQTVTTYAALIPLRKPGAVRNLEVGGRAGDRTRLVTWAAPKDNGGAPVTSYRVVVRKGTRTVLQRTVSVKKVKLRRADLPAGRLTVAVRARNSVGWGPAATRDFTVKK